ncbi:MAG: tRNA pseudouridine(55) synthase TruB [Pseudomonadota bacterium]
MARRKSGRPVTGWLAVDKPSGPTSTDVVNRARWLLKARKAGHAGTLDPAATGLLILAFGEATKALPLITDAPKTYEFSVNWGASTDTDDAAGTVTQTTDARPTPAQIAAALPAFRGPIQQTPPAYSAVKIDGQRAYAAARAGAAPELAARPLMVHELELTGTDGADSATFRMVCGKGGYVRAIARDLGAALGCLGHVRALRRTQSGPFGLGTALAWSQDTTTADDIAAALTPLEAGLSELAECRCDGAGAARLGHGNPADVIWTQAGQGDPAWASVDGQARALGHYRGGQFIPNRVFVREPYT